MRLILTYYITDGCSYGYDVTLPFEYASKEQAALDLLALCEASAKESDKRAVSDDIQFAGRLLGASHFWESEWVPNPRGSGGKTKRTYREPSILELDEWFQTHSPVSHDPAGSSLAQPTS